MVCCRNVRVSDEDVWGPFYGALLHGDLGLMTIHESEIIKKIIAYIKYHMIIIIYIITFNI